MNKSDTYVCDNLGLISLLLEDSYERPLRTINFGKDGKVTFCFKDSTYLLERTTEEIAQEFKEKIGRIKPAFIDMLKRLYGSNVTDIKSLGPKVNLVYSNRPASVSVERDELLQYVKTACRSRIDTQCVIHGIPQTENAKELIQYGGLETMLHSLVALEEGVEQYCPHGGQPNRPVIFDMINDNETPRLGFVEFVPEEAYKDPRLRMVYQDLLSEHGF